ncbi:DUF5684 domain-containing protein [Microbacterium sp.]|uniref:DUF5684 domain-containing protein n=2 Tax=Actinomycetes TaxID=1760 RepID=UPI0037C68EFC
MNDAAVLGAVISLLLVLVLYVWTAASLAAVFAKAGEEGYKAWIPVYNIVVVLQLAGLSGWFALLILVPPALWVALIVAYHRINRGFGVGAGMTVLAALVTPVWSTILGWGSARWLGRGMRRVGGAAPAPVMRAGTPPPPPPPASAPAIAATPAAPAAPAAYVVPPRPPAPAAAPPVADAPPARAVDADAWADSGSDGGGIRLGRSQAPFTQTFPSASPATPGEPAPAAPRRAFAPEPGAVPPPVSPFAPASAPPAAPAAAAGPAAPVQDVPAVPARPATAEAADPWAPPIPLPNLPVSARAAAEAARGVAAEDLDASAEVSAVADVPILGGPRSARASVSAQDRRPQIPDEEVFDETVISSRHRPSWSLVLPLGAPVAVTADVVIIGRRPSADLTRPGAQLVPVSDDTRTVSKTHARLERTGAGWTIVDLDSTNGVILVREDGVEVELEPGTSAPATERFLLGDAELRLVAGDGRGAG